MNCMRLMIPSLSTLALSALALIPLAASANPGALEINQDCVAVGCFAGDTAGYPITITAPGSYILTSDLAPPGSTSVNAIAISATPVDIDLNGHTINGGGTCTGTPVTGCTGAAGARGLQFSDPGNGGVYHVHNGTVRGFSSDIGIPIFGASDGTVLDHLTVTENSYGALIDGTTSYATTRIRDSQFVRNSQDGANTTNNPTALLIENSTAVGNGSAGFGMNAGSIAVGNRLNKNGGVGLACNSGCGLGQNTFSNNNGGGASAQWSVTTLRDMGGNVCLEKATCP